MYAEEEYLPLSGLQHLRFCRRQCALIHIEQLWRENYLTAHGRLQHDRVHGGKHETRKTVKVERGLRIASSILGLVGQADVVEFHADGEIIPVEYKHGLPKSDTVDEVQLCAEAICLEEMLGCRIPSGALFYFRNRKRMPVSLTEALREETVLLAEEFHSFVRIGITPPAVYGNGCHACSFVEECFPDTAGRRKSVCYYIKHRMNEELESGTVL